MVYLFSKVPFFGSAKKTLQASYQKFSTCAVAIHFQMSKTRMRKQTQECLSTGFTIRLFLRVKKRKANKSRLSALLKVIARGGLEPSTVSYTYLKYYIFNVLFYFDHNLTTNFSLTYSYHIHCFCFFLFYSMDIFVECYCNIRMTHKLTNNFNPNSSTN